MCGLINMYSLAVVLHSKPDTNFLDLEHVCEFVVLVRVCVKLPNDMHS